MAEGHVLESRRRILKMAKGVKVLDVDEGSAADKSGIKEDDVITEFDGKAVNSADELAEASREAKDKSSLKIKLNRGGIFSNY